VRSCSALWRKHTRRELRGAQIEVVRTRAEPRHERHIVLSKGLLLLHSQYFGPRLTRSLGEYLLGSEGTRCPRSLWLPWHAHLPGPESSDTPSLVIRRCEGTLCHRLVCSYLHIFLPGGRGGLRVPRTPPAFLARRALGARATRRSSRRCLGGAWLNEPWSPPPLI